MFHWNYRSWICRITSCLRIRKNKKCLRTNALLTRKVIGFDLNNERIKDLRNGIDATRETEEDDFKELIDIEFTSDINDLISADIYIISVPTPINEQKKPDLTCLKKASESVGEILKKEFQNSNQLSFMKVPYTLELLKNFASPLIENKSNLIHNQDFYFGYSPERINPGDKNHRLTSIIKITVAVIKNLLPI